MTRAKKVKPTKKKEDDGSFQPGARVSIIRHRHGWEDGRLSGTVKSVDTRRTGTKMYVVISDDTGCDLEVEHTRDMRPLRA